MSQEQSIDDLLRLLKESVGSEEESQANGSKKKKKQESAPEEISGESYAIDPDFFEDVEEEPEEEAESEEERAPWEEDPDEEEEEVLDEEEEEVLDEEEEEILDEEEEELLDEEEEEILDEEEEEVLDEEEEEILDEEEEEVLDEEEEEILDEEEEEIFDEEEEEVLDEEEEEVLDEEEEEFLDEEEEDPDEEEEEVLDEEEEVLDEEEEEILDEEEEEVLDDEEEEILDEEEEEVLDKEEEEVLDEEEEEVLDEEEEFLDEDEPSDPEEGDISEILDFFIGQNELENRTVDEVQTEMEEELLAEEEKDAFVAPETVLESLPIDELIPEEATEVTEEDVTEEEPAEEEEIPEEEDEAEVSAALLGLMEQLGCEDEIPDLIRADSEEEAPEMAKECPSLKEQYDAAKRKGRQLLLRLLGLTAISALLLVFDLLPLIEADLSGMLDYAEFPGTYLLIGLQLLVFGAVCLWKPLLRGIKRIVKGAPDLYSAVLVMLIFVAVYDILLAFLPSARELPPMFHFVGSVMMLAVLGSEYAANRRRLHMLEVLTADAPLYTLRPSDGDQSLAEKMYRGGMNRARRVYVPDLAGDVSHYDVHGEESTLHTRFLKGALIPITLLVIATASVGMMFEKSISEALSAAMIMLFATLPVCAVMASLIPLWLSASWMKKRGTALGDLSAIESYAECNVIVFRDLHLFRACRTEQTGIVFYDKINATAVMAGLEILYSHVGGPMKEIFSRVPDSFRAESIRIHRIGRGGIEALVDRKHVLLVGDHAFMSQYGLSFPESEDAKDRATLCVSMDGKVSAKINARYEIEPIFEMLVNRLAKEGIQCVVETFDPLIDSELVAGMRRGDAAPISVIHKSAADLYHLQTEPAPIPEEPRMVAAASRLKLAEGAVWCRRVGKVLHRSELLSIITSGVGVVATAILLGFGTLPPMQEYWLALYHLLPILYVLLMTRLTFPKRFYFSEDTYKAELARADERKKRAEKRQEQKNKGKEKRKQGIKKILNRFQKKKTKETTHE